MAEEGKGESSNAKLGTQGSSEKIVKVAPEDYSINTKDFTSVKVICLGDSAVGKSKLIERFLAGQYNPFQQSTFALTLFKYETKIKGRKVIVDFWDTAGQERFNSMHVSYYHQAHACILVFDITRKITYKNLPHWYKEMRQYRPDIPCILVANKIDGDQASQIPFVRSPTAKGNNYVDLVDYKVTERSFRFARDNHLPFYFVSASDGTNVVKIFKEAIKAALLYKDNSVDFLDQVMRELEEMDDLSSVQPVGAPGQSSTGAVSSNQGSNSSLSGAPVTQNSS